MSIINLDFQLELLRVQLELIAISKISLRDITIIGSIQNSLSPVKISVINSIMTYLMLIETLFQTYTSATVTKIEELWMSILQLEST